MQIPRSDLVETKYKKGSKDNIQLIIIIILRLTHLSRMEPPTPISRTRSFLILDVLGGIFHFIRDMRIYLPEKVIFTKAEVNITYKMTFQL